MWMRLVFAGALAWFGFSTVEVLRQHGFAGFLLAASANSATRLMLLDLTIALTLASAWPVRDARRTGGSYLPFLLLTLSFGAAGPLAYGVTRKLAKGVQRGLALALFASLGVAAATSHPLADLRTERARRDVAADRRLGRELLQKTAEAHGLKAWNRRRTLEIHAVDTWSSGGGWWPAQRQTFVSNALLGTFTSQVELLDGPRSGEVWGIQTWRCYRRRSSDAPVEFLAEPDRAIEFYLPTLQYFNELPFRLLVADIAIYAGRSAFRGRTYERVLASWRSAEPQPDLDQYELWIDSGTGLIAMARYTLRDAIKMATGPAKALMRSVAAGTIHFEDYREIEGVQIPFQQAVTLPEPLLTDFPIEASFFHRLEIESARFDTVPPDALIPKPELGQPDDSKD